MKYLILTLLLASCYPLRTYSDVVRMYGPPEAVDTLAHGYTRMLFRDGSGCEEFGFGIDKKIKWHWTAPPHVPELPHF